MQMSWSATNSLSLRNSHIYKLQEIKSYNLRPETHHITVRVNNNNNYAAVCKEGCELTTLSNAIMSREEKNKRLKPEDSRDELINSLFRLILHRFSLWGCQMMKEQLKPEDMSDNRWCELIID